MTLPEKEQLYCFSHFSNVPTSTTMIREGDDEGPTTITVSIEVVLAEAPIEIIAPEVTSDDAATEAPLDDTLPIKPKYILPLPFFRFRFIEGSCVETPTVLDADGATSESWEDKYPGKCPLWLNVIGWAFVFVPFFFN